MKQCFYRNLYGKRLNCSCLSWSPTSLRFPPKRPHYTQKHKIWHYSDGYEWCGGINRFWILCYNQIKNPKNSPTFRIFSDSMFLCITWPLGRKSKACRTSWQTAAILLSSIQVSVIPHGIKDLKLGKLRMSNYICSKFLLYQPGSTSICVIETIFCR